MDAAVRFQKFAQPEPMTGCWFWVGSIHPEGYGRFRWNGKTQKAHRVAYELFKAQSPGKNLVCHTCDERSCVNPDHLFLGDNRENNLDKTRKGRAAKKLLKENVRDIRSALINGEKVTVLAKKHGVTHSMIIKIRDNNNWRDI